MPGCISIARPSCSQAHATTKELIVPLPNFSAPAMHAHIYHQRENLTGTVIENSDTLEAMLCETAYTASRALPYP